MAVKLIDVAEPIWKDRSIGLFIEDIGPDDFVEITISYKNKRGKLLYPDIYFEKASDIVNKTIKIYNKNNLLIRAVKIKDLKLKNTIMAKKASTGSFISNESLNKIREDVNTFKKSIPSGANELKLSTVELKKSSKGDNQLAIEFVKSEDYYPLRVLLTFSQAAMDVATKKSVEIIERGFGGKLQPCDSIEDLADQLKQYINKQLMVAVRRKAQLKDTDKHGTVIVEYPDFWYCDNIINRSTFKVDHTKISVGLSEKDMERYNKIIELTGSAPKRLGEDNQNTANIVNSAATVNNNTAEEEQKSQAIFNNSSDDDDLPF